jgi:D-threo-aldose 1-dehydrogenase
MESGTMRTARLGDTGIETSVLGFGCADLFREPDSARRRRLFEAAVDAGIRHFDAAPMYGLGLVEGELGRFAQGRRDRLVIATKFGITPAPAARALARAQAPIRRRSEGRRGRVPPIPDQAPSAPFSTAPAAMTPEQPGRA